VKALCGLAALALVACSGGSPAGGDPSPASSAASSVGACTKAGASCQYAKGKLGVCTADERPRDCGGSPCTDPPPLVCISLH
jgi:hypothetical protein